VRRRVVQLGPKFDLAFKKPGVRPHDETDEHGNETEQRDDER
jgi:hypothetical protein